MFRRVTVVIACLVVFAGLVPALAGRNVIGANSSRETLLLAKLGMDPRARTIEQRTEFGLAVDADTITTMLAGAGDYGLESLGVSMSRQEADGLQLDARMAWQEALNHDLTPYVLGLDSYAGMWFDQRDNGSLTVALTTDDHAIRASIESRLPKVSRGLQFVEFQIPYRRLKAAAEDGAKMWDGFALKGAPTMLSMAVDTRANAIRVGVAADNVKRAMPYAAQLQAQFGIPVSVRQEEMAADTACTDRDHCSNPLKPGIRLAKGDTTVDDCAMAWHVGWEGLAGGGVNFVTAGHCGFVGNDCWYHTGYAGPNGRRVGCEVAGKTLLGPDGRDIMIVGMFDDQACECLYGSSIANFWGWIAEPSHLGAAVKASRAHSNDTGLGTITDDWISWISDKGGNVRVWGLDTSVGSNPGDSGSPVYFSESGWGVVGTLSNALGRVTYFDACYEAWGSQCWLYDAP